jgi:arsenate reductase
MNDGTEIVFLHNPRCSKSRQVRAILEHSGMTFSERRYLEEPLSLRELQSLGQRLALPPNQWIRAKETAYKDLGLSTSSTVQELYSAMAKHPVLMERPVVIHGDTAVIGRPPENVSAWLNAR